MARWWSESPINLPVYSGYFVARNGNQRWLVPTGKIWLKGCWVIHRVARPGWGIRHGNEQELREEMNDSHRQTSTGAGLAGMLSLSQGTMHAGAGPGNATRAALETSLAPLCWKERNVPTVSETKVSSDPASLLTCSNSWAWASWLSVSNDKIK